MIIVFTILIILWIAICWKHFDILALGLLGYSDPRYGFFNLDVMIPSWIAVGGLFLFIEWVF